MKELIKIDKCKVSKVGLELNENLTFEEWESIGLQLQLMHGSVGFWIGDWLNFGERKWGEKYAQAIEETGLDYGTLRDFKWVSNTLPLSCRQDNLSFTAHHEIASAPENIRQELIERATKNNLSSKEVRLLVKETKAIRQDNQDISISAYGDNIFFNSSSIIEERWDDHIIVTHFKEEREYIDKYPTLTRIGRFFKNGKEFSLREYAQVQEFPDSYKFVGTYSAIKSQIGNAVSPTMAKHIGSKLKGKTVIDLFAGCGGLSCGLEMIGKQILWANEYEKSYFQTYKVNHPNTECVLENIKVIDVKNIPDADIVVGGPPCQGFSNAGLRLDNDPRNELYKEFLRIVDGKRPTEFLLENVPQIAEIKDQIIEDFNKIGYQVETYLIKGEEIGMKQTRHRFFFLGKNERLLAE